MQFFQIIFGAVAVLASAYLFYDFWNVQKMWRYGWKVGCQFQPLAEDSKFRAGETLAAYAGIFLGCVLTAKWNAFLGVSIFSTTAKLFLIFAAVLGAVTCHATYVKILWPLRRWFFRKWDWPRYMKSFERKSPV